MKAYIKNIFIQDKGFLEDFKDTPIDFHHRLELQISYSGTEGIDEFNIDVCDKNGFINEIKKYFESEFQKSHQITNAFVHKTLLLEKFDSIEIQKKLTQYVNECEAKDYDEVFWKLSEKFEYMP